MAVNTALARIKTSAAGCSEFDSDWSIGANSDMGTSYRGCGLEMKVLRAISYLCVAVYLRLEGLKDASKHPEYTSRTTTHNSGCSKTPAIE